MEWKHLPVAGGIYDQHPLFIEAMMQLQQERSRYEEEKARERERENKQKSGMKGGRRGRR